MFPPSQGLRLDVDAISQIFGSISIACWIVVFTPQILENQRRSSADGLSVVFIIIWLLGDIFNILGAVLQGVLPTMVILAVYYTLADVVLLGQCWWYRGFTLSDKVSDESGEEESEESEDEPLLSDRRERHANGNGNGHSYTNGHTSNGGTYGTSHPSHDRAHISDIDRRRSSTHSTSSFRSRFLSIDGTHLSPVTPLRTPSPSPDPSLRVAPPPRPASTPLQSILLNASAILLVCAAGILGWYLSALHSLRSAPPPSTPTDPTPPPPLHFNPLGQVFGYTCAVLYLGSRIPQLLLNYRRKSTEGISMLFFLFACLGNATYVLSILVYAPRCAGGACSDGEAVRLYWRYVGVNASWLLGSLGTLGLDAGVFVQYFMYKVDAGEEDEEDVAVSG